MPHKIERRLIRTLPAGAARRKLRDEGNGSPYAWTCTLCRRLWPYVVVLDRFGCADDWKRRRENEEVAERISELCEAAADVHEWEEHGGDFSACERVPCCTAHEQALEELEAAIAERVEMFE